MAASNDNELAIMRLAWRLDALDEWRRHVDTFCANTTTTLNELTTTEEIANAVAEKMSNRHGVYLTRLQVWIAGAALVVPSALGALIHWAVG